MCHHISVQCRERDSLSLSRPLFLSVSRQLCRSYGLIIGCPQSNRQAAHDLLRIHCIFFIIVDAVEWNGIE